MPMSAIRFKNCHGSEKSLPSLVAVCISACVHLSLGLALALILIRSPQNKTASIIASLASQYASNEVHEIEFTAEPETQMLDSPAEASFEAVVELPAVATIEPSIPAASRFKGDFRNSITSQAAIASLTSGAFKPAAVRSASKATFFGAEAHGNRFVFVIDSSGSMSGPRWQALCRELIRALQSLSPDQEFFIISFDSAAHPMFGLVPQRGAFLNPTPDNVANVLNWLVGFQLGGKTYPSSAVGMAMRLEPDAIFLLSDGEISDTTIQDLRFWNHKNDQKGNVKTLIPIHTVLLHSEIGFVALQTIANENSGTFTPVRPF